MSGASTVAGRSMPGDREVPREIIFELSPIPETSVREIGSQLALEFVREGVPLLAEASPTGPNGTAIVVRRYGTPAPESAPGRSLRVNVAATREESLVPLMLSVIRRLLALPGNGPGLSGSKSTAYASDWCQPY